jgi:hypothetical protein
MILLITVGSGVRHAVLLYLAYELCVHETVGRLATGRKKCITYRKFEVRLWGVNSLFHLGQGLKRPEGEADHFLSSRSNSSECV